MDENQKREMSDRLAEETAERKQVERQLHSRETLLETLFESSPDAQVIVDADGRMLMVNSQVAILFGYARDEMIGRPIEMLLPERFHESHSRHRQEYTNLPSLRPMGEEFDLYGKRQEGSEFPVDVMLSPATIGDKTLIIAAVRDISPDRWLAQELREREALLSAALAGAPVGLMVIDPSGEVKLSIGKSIKFLWKKGDISGKSIKEVYRDLPQFLEGFKRALSGESQTTETEMAGLAFQIHWAPLLDEHNNIYGVVTVISDISERKQTEDALMKSETRFRTLFEKAAIGIGIAGLDGRWLDGNPEMLEMLGYSLDEFRQMTLVDLLMPKSGQENEEFIKDLTSRKSSKYQIVHQFRGKDGRRIWGQLMVSLVGDEDGQPVFLLSILEDVTEQKQMQDELEEMKKRLIESAENERLLLSQELHDGPVQNLFGATYQLQALSHQISTEESLSDLQELKDLLQQVIQELRVICHELRPPTLVPFGLEKSIRSHVGNFKEDNSHLKVDLDLMKDGQELPEHIRLALFRIYQQTMGNILQHAEASNIGVRLTLDSENVILEIRDDGIGFELPNRWIEFARKDHLGLVGAIERAHALGGELEVESSPGQGTTVRAILPLDDR